MKRQLLRIVLIIFSLTMLVSPSFAAGAKTIDAKVTESMKSCTAPEWYEDDESIAWLTVGTSLDVFPNLEDYDPVDFRDFIVRSSWVGISSNKKQLTVVGYYEKASSFNMLSMSFNPAAGEIEYTRDELDPSTSKEDAEKKCEALLSDNNDIGEYKKNSLHEILAVLSEAGLTTYENLEDVYNKIVSEVCAAVVKPWKNNAEWISIAGNPIINQIYYYKDDVNALYYIKVALAFDQNETAKADPASYYFKVSNLGFTQLSEPVQPISDEDWVLLNKYTEPECYETALAAFYNQRWKDPSSVTVYGYSTSYNDHSFTFSIDHAAKNSLGGTTRDYSYVTVDFNTNTVIAIY